MAKSRQRPWLYVYISRRAHVPTYSFYKAQTKVYKYSEALLQNIPAELASNLHLWLSSFFNFPVICWAQGFYNVSTSRYPLIILIQSHKRLLAA